MFLLVQTKQNIKTEMFEINSMWSYFGLLNSPAKESCSLWKVNMRGEGMKKYTVKIRKNSKMSLSRLD